MTDGPSPSRARPTGRDEVVKALVEAAADLFSEAGVDGVSVRQIADRAGVNHGLVHRHFGSKDELARRVGEFLDAEIRDAVGEPADFMEAIDRASVAARRDPRLWRFIARLLVDGKGGVMPEGHGSYLRALASLAERDQARGKISGSADPREVVFAIAALGLGIEMFGDYLSGAIGMGVPDKAALEDRFRDIALRALGPGPASRPQGEPRSDGDE
ncbi:MAG: TetR/AcrR family transcriptional regulator [Spirochaetes bacterium]|nr:TetR/AcrR family transcriptional regulator [Spirochaetota bacterium]MBU1079231.1 TetR/AcrR family transcriptional regulator [Spirochaetota bacterium]